MEMWFSEFHTPDVKHSIRINRQLYSKQSDYQRIDIFETPEFGRVLTLDGNVMLTERDEFIYDETGKVVTTTNNNGGINGGICNGMPVTFRVAFKPAPSISIEQRTVDLEAKTNTTVTIKGNHDCCFVPRAVPAVEAMTAIAILNLL